MLFLLLLFSQIVSSDAHPNNAGTCEAGNFGLAKFHGGSRKSLDQRHLVLQVDSIAVRPEKAFHLAQGSHNLTLTSIDGSTKFKGFFFRLQASSSTDLMDATTMITNISSLGRINPLCSSSRFQNVVGMEHTSKVVKSAVSLEFTSYHIGDYILDLHAVVTTESDWVYDQFTFAVKDADTITSSYISISPSYLSPLSAGEETPWWLVSKWTDRASILMVAICVVSMYFMLSIFVMIRKARNKRHDINQEIRNEKSPTEEDEPNHLSSIQLIPLIV